MVNILLEFIILLLLVIKKAKIGITQARQSAVSTLEAVMELNFKILENKNMNKMWCGCIVEVGLIMNILEVQAMVIQMIKDGYANVKDNLLDGITSSETYPFVLVDLASSENVDLASGAYKRFVHYLNVSVFDKAEDDIRDARETASGELEYILGILNFQLLENKIDYTDTVLNNVKVCGAGCIVEVDAYSDLTYGSTLAIGSNPSGANILIDGKYIGRQTPYFFKKTSVWNIFS